MYPFNVAHNVRLDAQKLYNYRWHAQPMHTYIYISSTVELTTMMAIIGTTKAKIIPLSVGNQHLHVIIKYK